MLKVTKEIPQFDMALIDADSLMYLISWVTPNQKQAERGLMKYIEYIIDATEVPEAYVFVKGDNNFRYEVDPEYKANRRSSMDPEVLDRVELLYSYARKNFIESHKGEADDYCSIFAYKALEDGRLPVICHIDKDLNMIPGWHYNFKKEEYYFISPQESFTFMCRQLMSGDMSADNIPGLKGIGDSTAAKFLHNKRLSEMKQEILQQWVHTNRTINGDGEYPTPAHRYERFLQSANCLILRETEEELRPLSEEEILRKMSWNDAETDYLFHKERDVTDQILLNSLPINCYMETKRVNRCKDDTDTGDGEEPTSTPTTTTDSSTESPSSSQESGTSVRKRSTGSTKLERNGTVAQTGKRTRQAART
ncbi:MAG TPA: hypothetical protein P5539_05595 [Mesotoga sp.]|nr:hypothetical protein [Mesotoga sp.]